MALSKKKLSSIGYVLPVESISRKFALRKEVAGLKDIQTGASTGEIGPIKFMGGSLRRTFRVGSGLVATNVLFIKKNKRTTPPSADELLARQNFAAASAWANAAKKDLSAITHNQLVWAEIAADPTLSSGGLYANGYNYNTFLFAYAYKVRKDGGTLPVNHQLPDAQ